MIRPPAARELAQILLGCIPDDTSDALRIDLAASVIMKAVAADEAAQKEDGDE